jgi:hypothetical protein
VRRFAASDRAANNDSVLFWLLAEASVRWAVRTDTLTVDVIVLENDLVRFIVSRADDIDGEAVMVVDQCHI